MKRLSILNLNQICRRVSCPAQSVDCTNNDNPFTPQPSKGQAYIASVHGAIDKKYILSKELTRSELAMAISKLYPKRIKK